MAELIQATVREQVGGAFVRYLRKQGMAPAVVYGDGLAPVAVAVDPRALKKATAGPLGVNTPIDLQIEGVGTRRVIVHEFQKHPTSDALLHVDFRAVSDTSPVEITVPIEYAGRPIGVRTGGKLFIREKRVRLRTTPPAIVPALIVDVENLDNNQTLRIEDVPLPAGCVSLTRKGTVLCYIKLAKAEDAPVPGAPAEGAAAPAAPAAAAPAAAAKPAEKGGAGGKGDKKGK